MQHLRVLEKADLIIVKRDGRRRWNYINPLPVKEIHDRWINRYVTESVEILARIKHDLEKYSPGAVFTPTNREPHASKPG